MAADLHDKCGPANGDGDTPVHSRTNIEELRSAAAASMWLS